MNNPHSWKPADKNIIWQSYPIQREDRERLHKHRGTVLWFTGLSGAGKSTLAGALEKALHHHGVSTYILDGDNIRHGLCCDLNFTPEDRRENIRRVGEVARLILDAGVIVLSAFISPYRAERRMVREMLPPGRFIEVFVDTPLAICEARDSKGLYKKARTGQLNNFTGINADYEAPQEPEIHLDGKEVITNLINRLLDLLNHHITIKL